MTYLAIPETSGENLRTELLAAAPLEAGAFCRLYHLGTGATARLVLGPPVASVEPWTEQRPDLLTPSGRRISAAVSVATDESCGLAFVHSHPGTAPPQLSPLDAQTTRRLGRTFAELLDGPFASLVVVPGGWAGTLTQGDQLVAFDRIATVGRRLAFHPVPSIEIDHDLDNRQVLALGDRTQRLLRALRVAIIGAGGLGSPIAETLVRIGVAEVLIVDPDSLDTISNARRIFGVSRADVDAVPPKSKAETVARALNDLGLGASVKAVVGDVRNSAVRSKLLGVDVVICGTDTHSSRAALTEFAMRAAVPLIDVGVRVGVRGDEAQLDALRLERRVQLPEGPCLWCWHTLSAEQVRLELMSDSERDQLTREGYVTGATGDPTPSVATLTVTAAGAATSALVGMLSGAFDTAPLGVGLDALTLESAPFSRQDPDPQCLCSRWRRPQF